MPPSSICTAARKPDGYNKAHLQEFGQVLQAWMVSQIPALNLLRCNGYQSIRAGLMAVAHDIRRMLGWVGISLTETS